MYECQICKTEVDKKHRVVLSCSHDLCKTCLELWQKRSNSCPFCRAVFVVEDPDPEEWLYLDPSEWVVYSRTDMKRGEEKIYVYRKDEQQPSWRNDDITIKLKRTKRIKQKIRNRNRE